MDEVLNIVLLKLYKQYTMDTVIRRYGISCWNLTEDSGLFEDAGDSLVICHCLLERGWAKIISQKKPGKMLQPWDSITITEEGIDKAEELLRIPKFEFLKNIYTATIEGIVRGLRG